MTFIPDSGVDISYYTKHATKRKLYGVQEWNLRFQKWGYTRWYTSRKAQEQAYNRLSKLIALSKFNTDSIRRVE